MPFFFQSSLHWKLDNSWRPGTQGEQRNAISVHQRERRNQGWSDYHENWQRLPFPRHQCRMHWQRSSISSGECCCLEIKGKGREDRNSWQPGTRCSSGTRNVQGSPGRNWHRPLEAHIHDNHSRKSVRNRRMPCYQVRIHRRGRCGDLSGPIQGGATRWKTSRI